MEKSYEEFIKKNFRPLKVRESGKYRMGRNTYRWVVEKENKSRLSHITFEKLQSLVDSHALQQVNFDDGYFYLVKPEAERDILVEYYQQSEEGSGWADQPAIKDGAPVLDRDLLESYRISDEAIELITGDSVDEMELTPDSVVDFISNEMIEEALEKEMVKIYYDEGAFVIIAEHRDMPDRDTYPIYLERILLGTEVSIDELDLTQKTVITGLYRDQVGRPKHDL